MGCSGGIDTWSFGWYLRDSSPADRAIRALATKPSRRFDFIPEKIAGHRIGYDDEHRFLIAEGHPSPTGLAPVDPDFLDLVVDHMADELLDRGIDVPREIQPFDRQGSPGFAGIRRLDLTADVRKDSAVGRAVLSGIAAVDPPGRLQSVVHRAGVGRAVETVTWRGVRGVAARAYDKGVESRSHRAGERIRLEDQRRLPRGVRPLVSDLKPSLASNWFEARFRTLWMATRGIKVTGENGAVKRVQEAIENGDLTAAQGYKALGYLIAERQGVEFGSRATRYRNRAQGRELGLVLADHELDEVEIDLEHELGEVLATEWKGSPN